MTSYDDIFRKNLRKSGSSTSICIINDGEKIDTNYGLYTVLLTDEMIASLQEGKALYIDVECGEYAVVLSKGI